MSDGDIRRGSGVLRRLLVEDVYGSAWRAIGREKQPKVIAVDIATLVAPEHVGRIKYAIAAGAHFRGVMMTCMVLSKGAQPVADLGPPIRKDGFLGEREFPLSEYLSSPSGVIDGRIFTRRDVIKYIANIRGGVHLGAKERKAEKKLVARLSKIEKRLSVHTTDGLLVELAAIGQAVAKSPDSDEFIRVTEGI
jgi:hypothetical protein